MADESMLRTLRHQTEAIWPLESRLFSRYALPRQARILDLGCGSGEASLRLAAMFPGAEAVYGVDPMPELLAVARARPVPASPAVISSRVMASRCVFRRGTSISWSAGMSRSSFPSRNGCSRKSIGC